MTQADILEIKNRLLKFAPDTTFSLHSLIDFAFPNNGFVNLTVKEYQSFFNDGFGAFLEVEFPHESFALMALWMESNVKKLTDFNEVVNLDLQRLIGRRAFLVNGKKTYRGIDPKETAERVCDTVLNRGLIGSIRRLKTRSVECMLILAVLRISTILHT